MTMPNGADGLEAHFAPWGLTNTISELRDRTQENVTAYYQAQVGGNPVFDGISDFFSTVFDGVIGLIDGLASAAGLLLRTILNLPGEIREGLSGSEDSNPNDLGTVFLQVRSGVQGTIDSIVTALFGWVGEFFSGADADQALVDTADTIAQLTAQVAELQSAIGNQQVGGMSAVVDFTELPTGPTFGADFDHSRSGGGGTYTIENGVGAVWAPVNDAAATDEFLYNALETATDYQKVWISFSASPTWLNGTARGVNEIHGRKNDAGDTYVYAKLEKNRAELGCVVFGFRTVFVTDTEFSFKSNGLYALECGTVGDSRIFRLLEGNSAILAHSEVGTTSQLGEGYRRAGGLGWAAASVLGSQKPGRMTAFALADNYPSPTTGSYCRVYRSSETAVAFTSGAKLPNNFMDTVDRVTPDYTPMLGSNNGIQVRDAGAYDVELAVKRSTLDASGTYELTVWVDSVVAARGGSNHGIRTSTGSITGVDPNLNLNLNNYIKGVFLRKKVYCEAGDIIYPGIESTAFSGVGHADGISTYMTITKA